MDKSLMDQLAHSTLFSGADLLYLSHLTEQGQRLPVEEGQLLLKKDQPNTRLYVLLSGRLGIRLDQRRTFVELGPGECVGEMSIVDGSLASADVVALETSEVLGIPSALIWNLVHRSHALAHNLLIILTRRLRHDNNLVVTEAHKAENFELDSQTDTLTGAFNRRWMTVHFDRLIRRTYQDAKECALLFFDVDHFKAINDSLGHTVGDDVLKRVSHLVQDLSRPGDVLARYAGDEFALLLPQTFLDQAFAVANRLVSRIAKDTDLAALVSGGVSLSVGVTSTRLASADLESLLASADEAMYRAKAAGRGRASL